MSRTLREQMDRQAVLTPDAVFLLGVDVHSAVTFEGLQRQSRTVATRLLNLGMVRGDRMAFLMENSPFAAGLLLGAWYGGFVAVPINPHAGRARLAHALEHSGARLVFVSESLRAELDGSAPSSLKVIGINPESELHWEDGPASGEPLSEPGPDDDALLIYTSGSTGQPKGVVLSHANLMAAARNCCEAHQLSAADRSLCVLPLYHLNAVTVTLLPSLVAGASVVLPPGFQIQHFWDWMINRRCTWSALVPTLVSQLLEWEDPRISRGPQTLEGIRFLRSSSAPLSPAIQRTFEDRFALPLIEAMGSTEAGGAITSNPLPPGTRKAGSPGRAYGFETRIVDSLGHDVPAGESGELLLRGPSVMRRYHRDPQETGRVFTGDGWLRTGDLARWDDDGYLVLVGRARELIIKGGVNIAPREIDEALESHPDVLEAAVVGIPDHHWGEEILGFVILRSGARGDLQEILDSCERIVGRLKTPIRIHRVDDFPRGPSGKVQRTQLVNRHQERLPDKTDAEPEQVSASGTTPDCGPEPALQPDPRLEQTISAIWAEILGVASVQRTDNFFACGGHSLPAMKVLSRLSRDLGVEVTLTEFLRHPTVEGQARIVSGRLRETGLRPPRVQGGDSSSLRHPLSPAQEGIWYQQQVFPESSVFHEGEAVRLVGPLNVPALEEALNIVVRRHESLRTVFREQGEDPVQIVLEGWRLQLRVDDLGSLPPGERDTEVQRHLATEPRLPFDLENVPGIRARLLRLGPTEHVLILVLHHLICDRTSIGVLCRELGAAYRSTFDSDILPPWDPPTQFGDAAAWERRERQEGQVAGIHYWSAHLAGVDPTLELPTLGARPAVFTQEGSIRVRRLGRPVHDTVRTFSQRERVSPFTVLLSAYAILISRLSGRLDFLIGVPVAHRDRPELESVVGILVDLLPLRVNLAHDPTFRDILHRIHEALLDAMAHRAVPLSAIVGLLNPPRDLSRTPLIQVIVNWKDRSSLLRSLRLEGLVVSPVPVHSQASKFDLTLALTDLGDDLDVQAEYCTGLFSEAMIDGWLTEYRNVLDAVLRNPGLHLRSLPELAGARRP